VAVDAGTSTADETRRHVRGSSALLAGRVISLAVNFGTRVMIVRGLTRAEFGAFAYGYAMIPAIRTVVALGQTQTISRFLSIYHERGEHGRLVGALVAVVGVVAGLGLLAVAGAVALQDTVLTSLVGDPHAAAVLAIMVVLGPLDALDRVCEGALAVLARPSEIFVRRYVVGPGLLLLAVVLTLAVGGEAVELAWAHVAAASLTALVSATLAVRALRRLGVLAAARATGLQLPFRELYAFSTPLLATELLPIALGPAAVAILGYVALTEAVATYQAVIPLARLNQSVIFTFTILYIPLASRLYARRDHAGTASAYWQTASWLLVLSLPAMILTLSFAEPTTVLLFGEDYRSSWPVLLVLSAGYLANTSTGFNAQTLQVHGHVGYLVLTSLVAMVTSLVAMLALAAPFGPVGVAVGVAAGLVTQNVLNHVGLVRRTGVPMVSRAYLTLSVRIVAVVVLLGIWQWVAPPPLWIGLAVGGVLALAVLVGERRRLGLAETFPEIARVPVLRWLVA
jgi:O-antigen/teichoic acid export membrane protein